MEMFFFFAAALKATAIQVDAVLRMVNGSTPFLLFFVLSTNSGLAGWHASTADEQNGPSLTRPVTELCSLLQTNVSQTHRR